MEEYTSRLREVWITSAEQLVALAATTGGITSIAEQLRINEDRARQLVESARSALAPQVLREMDRPVDTSEYGLGALRPESHNDERGES